MTFKNNIQKALIFVLILLGLSLYNQAYSQNNSTVKVVIKTKPTHINLKDILMNDRGLSERIVNFRPLKARNIKKSSRIDSIYFVELQDSNTVEQWIKTVSKNSDIEYCIKLPQDELLYTSNDPYLNSQYALSLCRASEAWEIFKGDSTMVIGVTDTGIDFDHEDLRTNIAYNSNDIIDGLDNDNDGYVDNYYGWDFGSNDNNPQWNESGTSGNAIHGTFTAGLAGARTDNEKGIACIGYSNKILPVKITNNSGVINSGYEAIIYAAEHGCQVVNCSWGSTSPNQFARDVIAYVTEDLGVIVVAAAGNQNNQSLYYPASYPNVVSVAAINSLDQKWSNSSYNWRVDISAPGENVLSTLSNSTYGNSSGTSFAAPIVASSLAFLRAYYPDTVSNKQLVEILKCSGSVIDTMSENLAYQYKLGRSRLDLKAALEMTWQPSVSCTDFSLKKDNRYAYAGDTAFIDAWFDNILARAYNLEITISSNSPYVEIVNSQLFIPYFEAGANFHSTNHFEVIISPNTPYLNTLEFEILYQFENHQYREIRTAQTTYPNIDFNTGQLSGSIAPEARLGTNYLSNGKGISFESNQNLVSEMGICFGVEPDHTLTNIRGYYDLWPQNQLDSISHLNQWETHNQLLINNDLSLIIKPNYRTFDSLIYSGVLWAEYDLINTGENDISNFYFGLFSDWDIEPYPSNYTDIDTNLRLAITKTWTGSTCVATQILSPLHWQRFAINNSENNYSDGLSRSELFNALSQNNFYEGNTVPGTDIMDLHSVGPLQIKSNDTIRISFAIHANSSISELKAKAESTKFLYDSLYHVNSNISEIEFKTQVFIYPNPAKQDLFVYLPHNFKHKTVRIYDTLGRLLIETSICQNSATIDISTIEKGVYLIKIDNEILSFVKE